MFFLFKPFVYIGKGLKYVIVGAATKGRTALKNYLIGKLVDVLLGMFTP